MINYTHVLFSLLLRTHPPAFLTGQIFSARRQPHNPAKYSPCPHPPATGLPTCLYLTGPPQTAHKKTRTRVRDDYSDRCYLKFPGALTHRPHGHRARAKRVLSQLVHESKNAAQIRPGRELRQLRCYQTGPAAPPEGAPLHLCTARGSNAARPSGDPGRTPVLANTPQEIFPGRNFRRCHLSRPSHRPREPAGGDRLKGAVPRSASLPFIQIRYFSVKYFSCADPGVRPSCTAAPQSSRPSRPHCGISKKSEVGLSCWSLPGEGPLTAQRGGLTRTRQSPWELWDTQDCPCVFEEQDRRKGNRLLPGGNPSCDPRVICVSERHGNRFQSGDGLGATASPTSSLQETPPAPDLPQQDGLEPGPW
ncbi:uncharacterized protein LOC115288682 [Suricata suricatta]|uniref:uncharacterized protein LOC115288682 n=1 Tax=Suricata suricatta TaxID=37032 RepID=UPI0011552D13|nr:uncharacterized protein LOC115288682 [Suricata suricatta]